MHVSQVWHSVENETAYTNENSKKNPKQQKSNTTTSSKPASVFKFLAGFGFDLPNMNCVSCWESYGRSLSNSVMVSIFLAVCLRAELIQSYHCMSWCLFEHNLLYHELIRICFCFACLSLDSCDATMFSVSILVCRVAGRFFSRLLNIYVFFFRRVYRALALSNIYLFYPCVYI